MIAAPPRWAHIPGVSYPSASSASRARGKYRPRQPSGITPKIGDRELRAIAVREAKTRRNEALLVRWHASSASMTAKDFAAAEGINYKVMLRLLTLAGVSLVKGRSRCAAQGDDSQPATTPDPRTQAILVSYERTGSMTRVAQELRCGVKIIYKVFKAAGVKPKRPGQRKCK